MAVSRVLLPIVLLAALSLAKPVDVLAECPGGGGPGRPPPPPPLPAVPTTPSTGTPTTGGSEAGFDRPGRGRTPVRTSASIDSRTWEYWWALNQSEYLPALDYSEGGGAEQRYAQGRDPTHEAAIDLLITALEDKENLVRTAAARSLTVVRTRYRREDQEKALLAGLEDPYREVREIAGLALARRGVEAAAEPLRDVLARRSEHRVTRAFAAMALVELRDEKGIELALRLSKDVKDPDLAGAILIGLGASEDKRFTDHLLTALRRRGGSAQRRRRVQCDAMMALGKLGDAQAVPALVRRLTDRERLIQRAAALALGGFQGSAEAADALVRRGLRAKDHLTRAFSVISLARLRHAPAYPRLGRMAVKDHDVVKGFALLGLGIAECPGSTALLAPPLETRQRYGEFGAAALAAGMLDAHGVEDTLAGVIGHLREPVAEGYASLALGLMDAEKRAPHMREHLWTDSATLQFGIPVGLGCIDAQATATWLDAALREAKRSSARGPLIDAVSLVGGTDELQTLVTIYQKTPGLSVDLKRRLLYAFARILTNHEPTWPRHVCAHTYFPFNNDVLAHLRVFP